MELMNVSERTPIYLGLITLSSALAIVTVIWAGVLGFGLSALVLESVSRLHK
ncbi:hypothetical protein [Reinekea sp. G2M2-21]|jgi:protein-S-isoprenylcysteine O-methyltransferase Ste14|uniref:hypothetical protein n=1 Tax=Reinekea sp. G2M2-21 TaxID=2788942 RepID=UPI0018AB5F88|nr:hypothetical protein [Reinekea sp. G2M2-21]MDX1341485.1 hypothetical protein [Reinekea sp.]MDX1475690.1 hypothetical protein [Reinekea sp.]